MAEKKITTPTGMAGLVRYEEEEKSSFQIDPKVFVGISVFLLLLEIALHFL